MQHNAGQHTLGDADLSIVACDIGLHVHTHMYDLHMNTVSVVLTAWQQIWKRKADQHFRRKSIKPNCCAVCCTNLFTPDQWGRIFHYHGPWKTSPHIMSVDDLKLL